MVESGLVTLISSGIIAEFPNMTGGFAIMLPENFISKSNPWTWVYRSILSTPLYVLEGQDPLTVWEVQIDAHGFTMSNAIAVARAIDNVLRGSWSGTFTDPDATVVQGIFRLPGQVDGFNDASRTYVRSLEYEVHYIQS